MATPVTICQYEPRPHHSSLTMNREGRRPVTRAAPRAARPPVSTLSAGRFKDRGSETCCEKA